MRWLVLLAWCAGCVTSEQEPATLERAAGAHAGAPPGDQLTLSVDPILVGGAPIARVEGGDPGEQIYLMWGDPDGRSCLGDVCVDVADALTMLPGPMFAGGDGSAEWTLDVVLPAGTVSAFAAMVVDGDPGSSETVIRAISNADCVPDAFEPNDELLGAVAGTLGTEVGLTACLEDDWYSFSLTAGEVFGATLFHDAAQGDVDLWLVDQLGGLVARAVSTADFEQISVEIPQTGTYYVVVGLGRDAGADAVGNTYELEADIYPTLGDVPAVPLADEGKWGIDNRPVNTSCYLPDAPPTNDLAKAVRANDVEYETPYDFPVRMAYPPGDDSYWYVAHQGGYITRFENAPSTSTYTEVLDLSDAVVVPTQSGLMSMAFHPDYAINGEVYVYYTRPPVTADELACCKMFSRVSRFHTYDGGVTFDRMSEEVLLDVGRPYDFHSGGKLEFGADGFLYLSIGDGGGVLDPDGHGQDPTTLFGSVLRIDVDHGVPYGIPADNPWADGVGGAPEVYAYGFRNPHTMSFDSATGELWVGDVSHKTYDEVNMVESGGNYGWVDMEGFGCTEFGCDTSAYLLPVGGYDYKGPAAVIMGGAYRGTYLALDGVVLYHDFYKRWVRGLSWNATSSAWEDIEVVANIDVAAPSFTADPDGEIWFPSYDAGTIHLLYPPDPPAPDTFPRLLSETGCFDAVDPSQPSASMVPFEVSVPLWSDAAVKSRFAAIPDGTTISVDEEGDFEYPVGTVLAKHFELGGRLIETRLLILHDSGKWAGYSYEWRADGSDADLLDNGKTVDIYGQDWLYPDRSDCGSCHTPAGGYALGPETGQLNYAWPYEGGLPANQLETWIHIGWVERPVDPTWIDFAYPAMDDLSASFEDRARGYLHSNCSHCHQEDGLLIGSLDMRYSVEDQGMCGVEPTYDLGPDVEIFKPGDPENSAIYIRTETLDPAYRMPPLATFMVHAEGVGLIEDWILDTSVCP